MLRDCRTAGWKVGSDLSNRAPAITQQLQNLSACWIGNRPEHGVALLVPHRNHLATNIVTNRLRIVKPLNMR